MRIARWFGVAAGLTVIGLASVFGAAPAGPGTLPAATKPVAPTAPPQPPVPPQPGEPAVVAPPAGEGPKLGGDPTKVLAVVQLGPGLALPKTPDGKIIGGMYGQDAEMICGKVSAALKSVPCFQIEETKDPAALPKEAEAANARYAVQIIILSRKVSLMGAANSTHTLRYRCTVHKSRPAKPGTPGPVAWSPLYSRELQSQGFDAAHLGGVNEYQQIAEEVFAVLFHDYCPYKPTGAKIARGGGELTVHLTNNSDKAIVQLTVSAPTDNPYITAKAQSLDRVEPGQAKDVVFKIAAGGNARWREGRISDVMFERAGLPDGEQPRKGDPRGRRLAPR